MKLLHTSDWHLGRTLYDKKRYPEFEAFLDWLLKLISEEKIDILLVAGDIFDSSAPGNRAQELYYEFLSKVRDTGCRQVVIAGGNHDSPTFLDAPKNLLGALNIKVIGSITGNIDDEILVVKDKDGKAEAIICAVPFLRDRDIRTVEPGENPDDKTKKLIKGISQHYKTAASAARALQDKNSHVPVIGMGHLFTSDGRTVEGDGVRELYIGSTAHVDGNDISAGFDYMALGHLHLAQIVGNIEAVRYSGSPLPMGFAEAEHTKKVIIAEFKEGSQLISEHEIPCFQELVRISGDLEKVSQKVGALKDAGSKAWLEVEITSPTEAAIISSRLSEIIAGSELEILRTKNSGIAYRALSAATNDETLETLEDSEVFKRCLEAYDLSEDERARLTDTYNEARASMNSADLNAG